MFNLIKRKKYKDTYFIGKVLFISIVKVEKNLFNIKYILKNFIDLEEYKGMLFFDIYTDNLELVFQIKKFGKWIDCEFDYYNVLLGIH